MRRYLPFSLAFLLSIVLTLVQVMEVRSADPSGTQESTKQTKKKKTKATAAQKKKSTTKGKKTAPEKSAPQAATPQKKAVATAKKSNPSVTQRKTKATKARATATSKPRKTALRHARPHRTPPQVTPAQSLPVENGALPDINKQISSKSVMVMDASSGATLFAKSPDDPRQPASTIKIVTAMIALKSLRNDDLIRPSLRAANMEPSKVGLVPGQDYRANDLINAVLLASANDASVALAEKIAGSESKFAHLMTVSAKMWGAQDTLCRTASGLSRLPGIDIKDQHSTARDLANLFRFAMQHNEFARRMRERAIRTSYGKVLRNHNKALWKLNGAVGGKTGYTVAARQTYVGQFTRGNQTIIVAIMGSESMWADLAKLVDYGFRKKAGAGEPDRT